MTRDPKSPPLQAERQNNERDATPRDSLLTPLLDEFRRIVREEIQAALRSGNRDRLLTAEQAAEIMACSPHYLYCQANTLPFTHRAGRMLRFSERGIMAYVDSKKSCKVA